LNLFQSTFAGWTGYEAIDHGRLVRTAQFPFVEHALDIFEWALGWYSIKWKSKPFLNEDDQSLWIAIRELTGKSRDLVTVRVVIKPPPNTTEDLVEIISDNEEEDLL
jgi:hypothetical protein